MKISEFTRNASKTKVESLLGALCWTYDKGTIGMIYNVKYLPFLGGEIDVLWSDGRMSLKAFCDDLDLEIITILE